MKRAICIIIATLVAALVLLRLYFPRVLSPQGERSYSYIGADYPRAWPIKPLRKVLMTRENTMHYGFDSAEGSREWDTLLPSGGAVVHLGPQGRPFTVSLFHQLRCLHIINDVLAVTHAGAGNKNHTNNSQDGASGTKALSMMLARHCMNYVRQMILCRANSRLEPMMARYGATKGVWEVAHRCYDWTAVYEEAEENYREYARRFASSTEAM